MFKIFADSHKVIASKIYDNIFDIYGVKLDKDKLLWGAVCPDILPQFKLIRHYKEESLNAVAKEIMKIIFISRYLEFNKILDPLAMKILSKKIGIISHYLCDYVCIPHANRWTFIDGMDVMIKHIKYESQLDNVAVSHDFKKNVINVKDLDIYDIDETELKNKIKDYINKVVEEYSLKTDFKNDLNFALSLNLKISYFILDTISSYSEELDGHFALEF
ncbi:zinc dependent phospholipase C family protein [Tissierella pigra]|uniref:Zinc dependent phospholipase C family protein n=1 Tax=Tissierella pigra TaxID=2607614 RepID=A0A6N7XWZ1_9FIRM|nr:zinc dependent phospholipase C family protein [Tissierella pigra]MBU5426410.1 zinc dependent phospholipase C family protein [Tissierella pigra]MSU02327.1 zinc dependent phospholipase C family protein [Tissierella pigra]